MKLKILFSILLFFLNSKIFTQDISVFNGLWYYDYSEIKIMSEWLVEKSTFDFSLLNPIEISEDIEEDNILQLEPTKQNIPLLLIDTKFQYFFGSIFDSIGKLNLFVKKGKNSLTDYSDGDVRFELINKEKETILKIFNDEREEFYVLLSITTNEMILKSISNNNKIHFKRI